MTATEQVSFQVKPANVNPFGLELGSVAVACLVDWDRERGCWRAWDDEGTEAFAETKLAAMLLCIAKRLGVAGAIGEAMRREVDPAEVARVEADLDACVHAKNVLALAALGGMLDNYGVTDSKIAAACATLGWTPEEAREWAQREEARRKDAP